jgi:hypothetical protein
VNPRVFLLSPTNCRGRRAQQVLSPGAAFPLAVRLRAGGVPIGDLFAHVSALYFRGKITYARTFGRPYVITPDEGLVPADMTVSVERLVRFAAGDINPSNGVYRRALERTSRALLESSEPHAEFVLLGSVASDKYVDVLAGVFGERLVFPPAFVGRGDMSRGGLLLRAAAANRELDYAPVVGAVRRGVRPPKLPPTVW